ncbi:MAG: hypothetical protein GY941_20245 [Planctomycetes bacterium]|nr:hypothetical protein [Planctomycetota bacterium]
MIKKKHLIERLFKALECEEEANTHFYIYTVNSLKHYKWLSEEKKKKIEDIIVRLRDDSQRHKTIVEKLIERVQESKNSVF